jgi:glucose-1-phosphate cytidylyltransferase
VILAGGLGTRISEETDHIPKPMVEIGGKPILWHIMKYYSSFGINDFIICCGYRGYVIKEYFANYFLHMSDVTFDFSEDRIEVHARHAEPWKVTLVDTGEATQTGGRLKRVEEYVASEHAFCFTYGDGLADVAIDQLVAAHQNSGRLATVTAVKPPGRFGTISLSRNRLVQEFSEKPPGDGALINGGFFVLSPQALDLIENDATIWERDPMNALVAQRQLGAYVHEGFWQPMDTLRDQRALEALWNDGRAPWRRW